MMKKYLYYFPHNCYNNESKSYEVKPLPNSDIKRAVIFGGRSTAHLSPNSTEDSNRNPGVVYLFLESSVEMNDSNYYQNVVRLSNLISLASGSTCIPNQEPLDQGLSLRKVLNKYAVRAYSIPEVSYAGTGTQFNAMRAMPTYTKLVNGLKPVDLEKFDNATYTYSMAKEIERMVNPHLKYTLLMTLYVSVINQLAEDVKSECGGSLMCSICGGTTLKHRRSSELSEIKRLIVQLARPDEKESMIKLVEKHYGTTRSGFLHGGKLSGEEKSGGFFIGGKRSNELVEDMVNLERLVRCLLERFLVTKSTYEVYA